MMYTLSLTHSLTPNSISSTILFDCCDGFVVLGCVAGGCGGLLADGRGLALVPLA